jgi:hypothetical protein
MIFGKAERLDRGYDTCVIVIVYVDDMILASRLLQAIQRVKGLISDRFEIDDLGQLKYYSKRQK